MKQHANSLIVQQDLIDIVKDQTPDLNKDEDPCFYISHKTKRGPLTETWIDDYWKECQVTIKLKK